MKPSFVQTTTVPCLTVVVRDRKPQAAEPAKGCWPVGMKVSAILMVAPSVPLRLTTSAPTIHGWSLQKYVYVPTWRDPVETVKVCPGWMASVKFVPSTAKGGIEGDESNTPSGISTRIGANGTGVRLWKEVTVWISWPTFVKVTVLPCLTVAVTGRKPKDGLPGNLMSGDRCLRSVIEIVPAAVAAAGAIIVEAESRTSAMARSVVFAFKIMLLSVVRGSGSAY